MQEDSQALVFTTKIFLVLQLAVLPIMWLWLQNPALRAGAPFISLRNTEDDGRCFPSWAAKWLPLSKGRGCTWLMDSCVSCEIARHLEKPDRKKGKETEMRKKKTERSCLDSMPEKGPAALSDFKCPLCEIVVSNANNLTAYPPPSSCTHHQHIMKCVD